MLQHELIAVGGWMARQWASGSHHIIFVHSHSQLVAHMTPYTLPAISPVDYFICEESTSPRCHTALKGRRFAVRSRHCWRHKTLIWASLRRFLTVCVEILWSWRPAVLQLFGWLIPDFQVKTLDAGPGLAWLHVVCNCEAGWMYWQIVGDDIGDSLWN